MKSSAQLSFIESQYGYSAPPKTNIGMVEAYLMEKNKLITTAELSALSMVKPITPDAAKTALFNSTKIFPYIPSGEGSLYAHERTLGLSPAKIKQVSFYLDEFMRREEAEGRWLLNLEKFILYDDDFLEGLPVLQTGFDWTSLLLSSILKKHSKPFIFLDSNRQCLVARKQNILGIGNPVDFIRHTLNTLHDGIADLEAIRAELIQLDMLKDDRPIPKEWLNDVSVPKNATIGIVKKGYVTTPDSFISKDIWQEIETGGGAGIFAH